MTFYVLIRAVTASTTKHHLAIAGKVRLRL